MIASHSAKNNYNIQELEWKNIRDDIKVVNPELANIIDQLDPNKHLTLIKARYPYGAKIIDNGILQLPNVSGKSTSIHEADVGSGIKNKLLYSSIPLSLPLNKGCEVYLNDKDRTLSLNIISPSDFFGLFEVTALLCNIPIVSAWSVSSGIRSIFMLPKIADQINYNRLKRKLNLSLCSPNSLAEHFYLFKTINDHSLTIKDWYCDIIFFTDSWFTNLQSNSKWAMFYNYLFKQATIQRMQSGHNVDNMAFNLMWQSFVYAMGKRNLKPRPYIMDTAKYLLGIAAGIQPAFSPADKSEIFAPTKLLQETYIDHYGLKKYLPTIFHSNILIPGKKLKHVYYSLAYPLLQEGLPNSKANQDVISDMREIKLLFETFIVAFRSRKIDFPTGYNLLDKVQFDFFHNGTDIFNELKAAKDMPISDIELVKDQEQFPSREFCATAQFLRGCVRISLV